MTSVTVNQKSRFCVIKPIHSHEIVTLIKFYFKIPDTNENGNEEPGKIIYLIKGV